MKKEWTKPKLVVLFRARADENVLSFCKLDTETGSGAVDEYGSCNRIINPDPPPVCYEAVNCQNTPES